MMAAVRPKTEDCFVEPAAFRAAMRELAAGVTIVTSGEGVNRRGLTATAVCSLSADPPTLLACINRDAECHRAILDHGMFCVNVLGAGGEGLAARFAGRDGVRGVDRFLRGSWSALATGAPVLEDAVASFDCSLREVLDGGTHSIVIGQVEALAVGASQPALVYRAGLFSHVHPAGAAHPQMPGKPQERP
jgi:flavin reductase (DIM6/NTAB) family NADH-FMN oxidoreductase RutF